MASPNNGDEYLTRREAEILIASSAERAMARWAAHDDIHRAEKSAIETALAAVSHERVAHVTAHEAAHDAHNREHTLDRKGQIERDEHHQREHELEKIARDKAEQGIDKRLEGMNEVRAQLKDQAITFARVETVQALFDRAVAQTNALTDRVIAIEKLDIKSEGRGLGQGAVIAYIVTAITVVGSVLGIVIVMSNLLTNAP